MNILILNFILSTAVDGKIIRRKSNDDTMIYTLARGFVESGNEVTLLASEEFKPTEPEKNDFEVIYFTSRIPKLFKPWLLPYPKNLAAWLKTNAHRYDLVLSVESFSIPTLIASRFCKSKLIIWQEMAFHQHFMHKIPAKLWYNIVSRIRFRNILTIAQSTYAKEFISQYHNNISSTILNHGSDGKIFFPEHRNDQKYFIVLSMLVARKRIDRILRKFADFLNHSPYKDYKLKIVGDGPEKESLQNLTSKLSINNAVEFLGFMDHLKFAPIGRKATALLIDTEQDNNMVTIPESIINGTPILINTVPNNNIIIRDNELGIVKESWDWNDLCSMVEHYDTFHENCIKTRHKFTNTGVAQNIIAVFSNRK